MPSSYKVAHTIYSELSESDRRAVDAWRTLGNDLLTSLFNSGVLGSGPRRQPLDDPSEWSRRMLGRDPAHILRQTCEHEAAHAVVASELGLRSVTATIRSGPGEGGVTYFEPGTERQNATVFVAASVWIDSLRATVFPRGANGCSDDMRKFIRSTGCDQLNVRDAGITARRILREQSDLVLTVADMLQQYREVKFPDPR